MSDTAAPSPATTSSGAIPGLPLEVRYSTLLWIMMIVPLGALIGLFDYFVLDGYVKEATTIPHEIFIYAISIVALPHIIASMATLADREYIQHYRTPLIRGALLAFTLGMVMPLVIGYNITWVLMSLYTVWHAVAQQYGITLMMLKQRPNLDYEIWKWATILPGTFGFVMILGPQDLMTPQIREIGLMFYFACIFIAGFFGYRFCREVMKKPNTKIAVIYFALVGIGLYVCFCLLYFGYTLIALLVPRLIHDFTAFWIYMVHDQNRNADKVRNPIYIFPMKIGITPVMIVFPLSMVVSLALLYCRENMYFFTLIIMFLNFMHYYMESYMWKRGTPHRQYTPFRE